MATADGKPPVAKGNDDGKPDSSRVRAHVSTRAQPVPSPPVPTPPNPTDRPTPHDVGRSVDPRLTELAERLSSVIGPGTDWTTLPALDANDVADLLQRHGTDALVHAAKTASFSGRAPGQAKVWVAAFRGLDHKPTTTAARFCDVHQLEHRTPECPSCRADRLAGDQPDTTAPAVGGGAPMPDDLRTQVRNQLATPPSTTTSANTAAAAVSYTQPPDQPPDEPQAAPVTTPPKTPAPSAAAAEPEQPPVTVPDTPPWPDEPPF
jgi:hypothetical protein